MKKHLLALLLAGTTSGALAADIHAENAWARPTVAGMNMGGAFLSLHNDTARNDVLVSGESPVAARVEIHHHVKDGEVMRMRELPNGLPLPAGKTVMLKPGAEHVMLMGLKKPLQTGDHFPLTLKFKHAKPLTVNVVVGSMQGAGGSAPGSNRHMMH